MSKFEAAKLIGLSIVALKGYPLSDKRIKNIELAFILFSDGESFIHFDDYRECDTLHNEARLITNQDKWREILYDYPDANFNLVLKT